MQAFLQGAFDNNAVPRRTAGGAQIVRQGNQYRTLVDTDGSLTSAGRQWQTISGTQLATLPFDLQQTPVRDGAVEYIMVRGRRRVTRRYNERKNDFDYTRLGMRFYGTRRIEYVVRVPSIHSGTRSNGQPYTRPSAYPIETPISLPATLTALQRDRRIRAAVNTMFPDGVIAEFSEERVTIDPNREWGINEMITVPGQAAPETTVLDRPLGTRPSISNLLFPEHLCEAAFDKSNDFLCVARQLAEIRKQPFEEICCELDQYATDLGEEDWRHRGATSKLIFHYAARNMIGACCLHGVRVIETLPGPTPLCWAIHENHAFFYASKKVCKQLASRVICTQTKIKREPIESKTPAYGEWQHWPGKLQDGHFWHEDLDYCRAHLLSQGRHARCTMRDDSAIKTLTYRFTAKDKPLQGSCVIHHVPQEGPEIDAWLQRLNLGICYRGEGLAGISNRVLLALIKRRPREHLDGEAKHACLEAHGFACALCNSKEPVEFDHKVALKSSFGQQVFQPLCAQCHTLKTNEEPRELERNADVLASHFNQHVWKNYILTARPPPLVHKFKTVNEIENLSIADVVRCRKRALEHNCHEVPLFSPLDDIQPVNDFQLGDLMFCDAPYKCCVRQLGYSGAGWMARVQAEWLLYANVVTWADFKYKLVATGRLPHDIFKQPLHIMEQAWQGGLAKQSVNAMIGAWCLDQSVSYTLVTSNHPGDQPANSLKRTFRYPGGSVIDFLLKTKLLCTSSMRPLHDLCMCTEAVRVGQMLYTLKKQRATIYELKTDSVLFRQKTESALKTLRFCDLRVRDLFEKAKQRRLDQHSNLAISNSEETVFRVTTAVPGDPLITSPKGPRRNVTIDHQEICWKDLDEEAATAAVLRGESLYVEGVAGTGKTTFLKTLVQTLREQGKRVDIISKTHCAASRAGGCTADHFCRRHILNGICTAHALWIDECFQLETGLYKEIQKLQGRQFLLSGDAHQFGALFDQWRGTEIKDRLRDSRLLYELAGGNRLVLTRCRRSEIDLFDWYCSLIPGGSRFDIPLETAIAQARQRFRFEGPARHNLVLSHRRRVRLNASLNRTFCPAEYRFIRCASERGQLCAAQNMLIWIGIELLGCSRTGRKIKNNVLYTVQAMEAERVLLTCESGEVQLNYAQVAELLRLSFAQTYASCQGTEFNASLRCWDCENRNFTRKHLFVAISRARRAELIDIQA